MSKATENEMTFKNEELLDPRRNHEEGIGKKTLIKNASPIVIAQGHFHISGDEDDSILGGLVDDMNKHSK